MAEIVVMTCKILAWLLTTVGICKLHAMFLWKGQMRVTAVYLNFNITLLKIFVISEAKLNPYILMQFILYIIYYCISIKGLQT